MIIYLPEADEIYSPKTKQYFKEVLSSYSNGNYRSATVMLYSVALCDILFKLQELKDVYNDTVATEILDSVEKTQKNKSSKSAWEKQLIDKIYESTELLDLKSYSDLNHLFDDRNLSAHPAINQNYELISPTQETTIAHIKNILSEILVKPPIFIKNVIEMLTDDLRNNASSYTDDLLAQYLENKYFSRMNAAMKLKVFRVFWKLCFKLPDDENCVKNIRVNRASLQILVESNPDLFAAAIREDLNYYEIARNDLTEFHAVAFFANYPLFYNAVSDTTRAMVNSYLDSDEVAKCGAWFRFKSLKEHLQYLRDNNVSKIDANTAKFVANKYRQEGQLKSLLDFYIEVLGRSRSFNSADERYANLISPYLNEMTAEQIEALIQTIDSNDQVNKRNINYQSYTAVALRAKQVLPEDFDFSKYSNFKYDVNVLNNGETEIGNEF